MKCILRLERGCFESTVQFTTSCLHKTRGEAKSIRREKNLWKARYKQRILSLHWNLREEKSQLPARIHGDPDLCEEAGKEWGPEKLWINHPRRVWWRLKQEEKDIIRLGLGEKRHSGMLRCRSCGGDHTTWTQVQTRSADESMTVFASCLDCGNRWKM